jgi:excisionase family DNA binding protein
VTPEAEIPALLPVLKDPRVSGISKTKLHKMIEDGKLKACLVGKHMRIRRVDLAKVLNELPKGR